MKILFASDIHGYPFAVERLEEHIVSFQPDRIVLLGDLLDESSPEAVPELLNRHAGIMTAVQGNCDYPRALSRLQFPVFPEYTTLTADGHVFFLTHGHFWSPRNPPPFGTGDILCSGHTHIPMAERTSYGMVAFNPGSLALPRRDYPESFGLYENNTLSVLSLEVASPITTLSL